MTHERLGFLDKLWAWETEHPFLAYSLNASLTFVVLFTLDIVAFNRSLTMTLAIALPISFIAPILRFVTVAGWRGAPRPSRWRKDRRYYRGPLR